MACDVNVASDSKDEAISVDYRDDEEELDFVDPPKAGLECPICYQVLREPHIVSCCGRKMCHRCIARIQYANQPCPVCRQDRFTTMLEKQLQREVLDLKVRCPHSKHGCVWVGELRDLPKHTSTDSRGDCQFVEVTCQFGCTGSFPRHQAPNHESVCRNLPPELQIQRTLRVTERFREEYEADLIQAQERCKMEISQVEELTAKYKMAIQQLEDIRQHYCDKKKEIDQVVNTEMESFQKNFFSEQQGKLHKTFEDIQEAERVKHRQQLESVWEQHKSQLEEMKRQFNEEQKQQIQLVKEQCHTEYQQQMSLLTKSFRAEFNQEMSRLRKKTEEDHQQQMNELRVQFEKQQEERLTALKREYDSEHKKQLMELKTFYDQESKREYEAEMKRQREKLELEYYTQREKQMDYLQKQYYIDREKQLDILKQQYEVARQRLSAEVKQLYNNEHKQQMDECRKQCIEEHQQLQQQYHDEHRRQLDEQKAVFDNERMKQMEQFKRSCTTEQEKQMSKFREEMVTVKQHDLDQSAVSGFQEAVLAQGKSFTGLSRDVLLLMPQLYTDRFKGMFFHPEEGRVEILSSTEEEQEKCISQFQEAYQAITKNRQLKTGDLTVPPSFSTENLVLLLEEFNGKYSQCIFSFDEKSQSIRIVSISSRQFDQAKKLIFIRLMAGNSSATPTTGSQGKAASKISAMGSSETLTTGKGRKITVKRGNIVTEDTDIIVNAANGKLDHIAGVAGALNKASLGELQKKSNAYIQQHGSVPVGEVAVTKAGGQLKCKRVIHAVGPVASQHTSDLACSELIFQAVTNALIEAQKINAISIAFPALSTGIYAVNKALAADAIFQALQTFHYTSNKILKDIRIVILDEPTYLVFAQHLIGLRDLPAEPVPGSQCFPAQIIGFQPKSSGTHPTTAKRALAAIAAKSTNDHNISSSQSENLPPGFSSGPAARPSPVVTANTKYPVLPTTTKAKTDQGTPTTVLSSTSHSLSSATTAATSGGPAGTAGQGVWWSPAPHLTAATNGSHAVGTAGGGGGNSFQLSAFSKWWSSATAATSGSHAVGTARRGRGNFIQSPTFLEGAQPTGTSQVIQTGTAATSSQLQSFPNQAMAPSNVSGMGSSQQDENYSTPSSTPPRSPFSTPPRTPPPDDEKETPDQCPICLTSLSNVMIDPVRTHCCNQLFCKPCIDTSMKHSCYCPICKKILRSVQGNQPAGGTMNHVISNMSLPGYEGYGTIVITYHIPDGIQSQEHPNPGQRYKGTTRTAYLPNSPEGLEVLGLLRKAFDARLIFTVGTSHTTSQSNVVVWNDIHHKTMTHGQPYGYPDPSYLQRVKEELRAKGIQ